MCPPGTFYDILTLRRAENGISEHRPPDRPQICPVFVYSHLVFTPTSETPHPVYTNLMTPFSKNMSQNTQKFTRANLQKVMHIKVAYLLYNTPTVTPQYLHEINPHQQIHSGISKMHLCPGSKHPNSMIPLRLPVKVSILVKMTKNPIHAQFTPTVAPPSLSEHPYPP